MPNFDSITEYSEEFFNSVDSKPIQTFPTSPEFMMLVDKTDVNKKRLCGIPDPQQGWTQQVRSHWHIRRRFLIFILELDERVHQLAANFISITQFLARVWKLKIAQRSLKDNSNQQYPWSALQPFQNRKRRRNSQMVSPVTQGLNASGGGGTRMTPLVSSNWMSTRYPTPSKTEMAPVIIAVLWPFFTSASAIALLSLTVVCSAGGEVVLSVVEVDVLDATESFFSSSPFEVAATVKGRARQACLNAGWMDHAAGETTGLDLLTFEVFKLQEWGLPVATEFITIWAAILYTPLETERDQQKSEPK